MTPDQAIAWTTARWSPASRAERMSGGLINHVFRVWLTDGDTVIVKQSPPHVATAPHIPLDPARSQFEAAALAEMERRRGPAPALLDAHQHTIIMQDLGDPTHLGEYLADGGDPSVVDRLAEWLRVFHDAPRLGRTNTPIQQTRMAVQYSQVGGWLAAAGVHDATALGERAKWLGRALQDHGDTFVMGDLWPPSVLVGAHGGFHVIDWEMCTDGRLAQDVGHLAAHLDLGALRGDWPSGLAGRFSRAYGPIAPTDAWMVSVHRAAELLTRSIGAFPSEALSANARDAAVAQAVTLFRNAGPTPA